MDVFQGPVFSKLRAEFPSSPSQQVLWTNYVEFTPAFYASLQNHAVPLRLEAISALKHSSRALDIYVWLAHRLCRVKEAKPVTLRWTTLRFQFGTRTQDIKSFKRAFKAALKQVLFVYPDANVSIIKGGLLLRSSKPPVARIQARGRGRQLL